MAALVQRIRARAASLPTFDIPFLLILLLLLSYGLIMLFSAGYAVALYRRGDAYTYIRPQLLFAALGVLAMYAASLVDYHVWHRLAWTYLTRWIFLRKLPGTDCCTAFCRRKLVSLFARPLWLIAPNPVSRVLPELTLSPSTSCISRKVWNFGQSR